MHKALANLKFFILTPCLPEEERALKNPIFQKWHNMKRQIVWKIRNGDHLTYDAAIH